MPKRRAKVSGSNPRGKRKTSQPKSIQDLKGILHIPGRRAVSIQEMNEAIAEGFIESAAISRPPSRTT